MSCHFERWQPNFYIVSMEDGLFLFFYVFSLFTDEDIRLGSAGRLLQYEDSQIFTSCPWRIAFFFHVSCPAYLRMRTSVEVRPVDCYSTRCLDIVSLFISRRCKTARFGTIMKTGRFFRCRGTLARAPKWKADVALLRVMEHVTIAVI